MEETDISTVAFVGLGVMGRSMARNLMCAGYRLRVYTRTQAKARELLAEGAEWVDSPAEALREAQAAISMVGMPEDVESTYFGAEGLLAGADSGALLIDMTTSRPALAMQIADAAKEKGCEALDAPVSGGDIGAREARLTIMAGGHRTGFERALPLFEAMGKNILWQGEAGAGQMTKICNQISCAGTTLGAAEAMAFARKAGLDPARVLESITTGAAGSWSLSNLAPRMLEENFAPGFYVKHIVKDLGIALEAAEELGLNLPLLELARSLWKKLSESGGADLGTHAIVKLYLEG